MVTVVRVMPVVREVTVVSDGSGERDARSTNPVTASPSLAATVAVAGFPRTQYELHVLAVENGMVDGLLKLRDGTEHNKLLWG